MHEQSLFCLKFSPVRHEASSSLFGFPCLPEQCCNGAAPQEDTYCMGSGFKNVPLWIYIQLGQQLLVSETHSPGGITNTLIAELFIQSSRPAAYMIGGTISWVSFFTIGMLFPFVVVSACNTFSRLPHLLFNLLSGSIIVLFPDAVALTHRVLTTPQPSVTRVNPS